MDDVVELEGVIGVSEALYVERVVLLPSKIFTQTKSVSVSFFCSIQCFVRVGMRVHLMPDDGDADDHLLRLRLSFCLVAPVGEGDIPRTCPSYLVRRRLVQ